MSDYENRMAPPLAYTTDAHQSALCRFRRAMRRHEARARRHASGSQVANLFALARQTRGHSALATAWSQWGKWNRRDARTRTLAFLYARASDALSKLQIESEAASAASQVRKCLACGQDPEAWAHVAGGSGDWRVSGHACHCVRDNDGRRIAVGICCGHMLGAAILTEEDAADERRAARSGPTP